jgi:hypothetical protein
MPVARGFDVDLDSPDAVAGWESALHFASVVASRLQQRRVDRYSMQS